jgi:hypothetical protein
MTQAERMPLATFNAMEPLPMATALEVMVPSPPTPSQTTTESRAMPATSLH